MKAHLKQLSTYDLENSFDDFDKNRLKLNIRMLF